MAGSTVSREKPMSFRSRLTLFFLVIVLIPMMAVAVVFFDLVTSSEEGKAKAKLQEAGTAAEGLARTYRERGEAAAARLAGNDDVAEAIRSGQGARIRDELLGAMPAAEARAVRLVLPGRRPILVGPRDSAAPVRAPLTDAGRPSGDLHVSVVSVEAYMRAAAELVELRAAVTAPDGRVISNLPGLDAARPGRSGVVRVGSERYRFHAFTVPAIDGRALRGQVLLDETRLAEDKREKSVLLGAVLVAFLTFAFACAVMVSRSLHGEIARLLDAVRRVRRADFAVAVPVEGNDAFAQLGQGFNAMARELEQRLAELQRERARLQGAIRRVGASFAKGLDRDAVIGIVVETAVDGVGAACGRALIRRGGRGLERAAAAGSALEAHDAALNAAEAAATSTGKAEDVTVGGMVAMAHPMHAEDGGLLGILAVSRDGEPYTEAERDLLQYLAGQAAISIENVELHEAVQRQAVTDELTGLYNHRKLQEVMTAEMERTRRFGHQLGLIMLDIDNFKRVNDQHGHMQGDLVLREVARVLRETSRGVDLPARYGGEEMAVVLPQADLDGAYRFAERVRTGIEALDIPLLDRAGTIKVTASLGVAAAPSSAPTDKDALVAAADAALYRAKREGKNRTVRAEPVVA